MAIRSSYSEEQGGCLIITFYGKISDQELINYYEDIFEGDQWIPRSKILCDLSQSDFSAITVKGLNDLVDHFSSFIQMKGENVKAVKVAFFAPDDLQFGLSRMYEALAMDIADAFKVFRKLPQALSWLS